MRTQWVGRRLGKGGLTSLVVIKMPLLGGVGREPMRGRETWSLDKQTDTGQEVAHTRGIGTGD